MTCPFPVRAIRREVSFQEVRRDVEAVVAVCRRLELPVSFHRNAVLTHQTADAAVPHIQPQLLQFLGHARTAIAAQAQAELFPDMGKNDQVPALATAHGAAAPGAVASGTDIHDPTQATDGHPVAVFFLEAKSHLLL